MAVGEWDRRELCSDGGCVGVIGPAGTCKVCGRAAPNWGDERKRGLIEPETDAEGADAAAVPTDDELDDEYEDDEDDDEVGEDADGDDADGDDPGRIAASAAPSSAAPGGVWGERELCSNGACIGVIGSDGRCKMCGQPAQGGAARAPAVDAAPAPEAGGEHATGEAPPPATAPVDTAAAVSVTPDTVLATGAAGVGLPCSDPTCKGTTAADGRCGTCGKVAP